MRTKQKSVSKESIFTDNNSMLFFSLVFLHPHKIFFFYLITPQVRCCSIERGVTVCFSNDSSLNNHLMSEASHITY